MCLSAGILPTEVDVYGIGALIADNVVTAAAVERIGPEVGHDEVVAGSTFEDIAAIGASDDVGVRRSNDILDAGKHVAFRRSVVAEALPEADPYAYVGVGIAHGVAARAAIDRVGAVAAREGVVALTAIERVGAPATSEVIVATSPYDDVGAVAAIQEVAEIGAGNVLDTDVLVAICVSAVTPPQSEADLHGPAGIGVAHGVDCLPRH